jgi:dTDP-4-amino-4,6-dideoxygalactose transaminase
MIHFADLPAEFQAIRDEIFEAITPVMESGQFALGFAVQQFEEDYARYCRVEHAVGVNSGTSALHLALLAAGVGEGDEVITVSHTFIATIAAIRYTGARPVLVEVETDTYNIDPSRLEEAITPRTRAIIPVHLYGQPADMDPILDIARKHDLVVVEDACQAHGAEYKGRRCGSMGDLAAFSFYPGKNLGAFGEGGAVTTNNADYAEKIRSMRHWGQTRRYYHDLPGYNYRMDGIQGAVLSVKLRHIEAWTDQRIERAAWYDELLEDGPFVPPVTRDDCRHVYHRYVIETDDREALQEWLTSHDIDSGIHYPVPVHLQGVHADLGYSPGDLPVTERAAARVVSLPLAPQHTREDIETVASCLRAFAGRGAA